jgi:hypothetical protein
VSLWGGLTGVTMAISFRRDTESEYRILVEKLQGDRRLERSRRGWKNNIKIYLEEQGTKTQFHVEVKISESCHFEDKDNGTRMNK